MIVSAAITSAISISKDVIKRNKQIIPGYSSARLPNPLDAIEKPEFNWGRCLDSDGSINYFTAGSATYFPPMTSKCQAEFAAAMEICSMFPIGNCLDLVSYECKPRTTGDRCISGSTLREAYCSSNSVRTRDYRCPSGCSIAQCISLR